MPASVESVTALVAKAHRTLDPALQRNLDELAYRLFRVFSQQELNFWVSNVFIPVVIPQFCNELADRKMGKRTAAITIERLWKAGELTLGELAEKYGLPDAAAAAKRVNRALPILCKCLACSYDREIEWLRTDVHAAGFTVLERFIERMGKTKAVAVLRALNEGVDYHALSIECQLTGPRAARRFYMTALLTLEVCIHEERRTQDAEGLR